MNKWLATTPLICAIALVSPVLFAGCVNNVSASHATVVSTSVHIDGYNRYGTPYSTAYITLSKNGQAITLHTDNSDMVNMLVKGADVDFTYDPSDGTLKSIIPSQFHDSSDSTK